MADTPPLIAVAYHEAGHAVMAAYLRCPMRLASIVPGDGFGGYCAGWQGVPDTSAATVFLAGPEAEARARLLPITIEGAPLSAAAAGWQYSNPTEGALAPPHPDHRGDHELAMEHALRAMRRDIDLAELLLRHAKAKSARELARLWPRVEAVARALLRQGVLYEGDLACFMEVPVPAPDVNVLVAEAEFEACLYSLMVRT